MKISSFVSKNKTQLLILGVTSILCSSVMLRLFNDPEGPNLLVVAVMAAILYFLSLAVYFFSAPKTNQNKFLLVIFTPIVIATGFYFWLR